MNHYRATRDVAEHGWTKGQEHIELSDADAKKWLNSGALVKMTPPPVPPPPVPGDETA